jgi:hypothetical protein
MPKLPLLAVFSALQLLTRCGGGGAATVEPLLQSESYIGGALDAKNLFHWTPRAAADPIELHLVIRNEAAALPPGLAAFGVGSAEVETLIADALRAWIAALPEPIALTIHAAGGAPEPAQDLCCLEVSFAGTADAGLSGYAWLETRFLSPRVVDAVRVEISVPDAPEEPDLRMLQALVLHELGHAMGIVAPSPRTGHSSSPNDVMHPEVHWTRLSAQDELAIRELYALEPNLLRGDGESNAPQAPGAPASGDPTADASVGVLDVALDWIEQRITQPRLRIGCGPPR